MKNLMKNDNYVAIGSGILAFVVFALMYKRRNNNQSSSFLGDDYFEPTSKFMGGDYFEPSSKFVGEDYFEPSIK